MPQLTNKHRLPAPLVSALTADWYHQPGHISVTGLIKPPRIRQLELRYTDQIVEDVSDKIWMLLGSAVHGVLERAETVSCLQEERLAVDVAGWTITGQADLWEEPGILSDYKITSVWAGINGPKTEWESQLNIYAHLYRVAWFPVEGLQVVAIYRDWQKNRAKQGNGYPQCAAGVLPVMVWPEVEVQEYIKERVTTHQAAESLPDIGLPYCTPEERWERPTTYAVMKKGRKSAVRVLGSRLEADEMAEEKGAGHYVEVRPGESVRCEGYCQVAPFCSQYQKMKA